LPLHSVPASFERVIALRYLRGARGKSEGRRFLRLITRIAIGGVALGVAALILALSIVRGFSNEIEKKIVGFGADVQVENYRDAPLSGADGLRERLEMYPAVEHVSPVVEEFVLLRKSSAEVDGAKIWGTDVLPSYLQEQLVQGTASFEPDAQGRASIILGSSLARTLDLSVGDRVTAFSMRNRTGAMSTQRMPKVKQFRVAGIFETSLSNFDDLYAFTGLSAARDLLSYRPDEATRFDLTLLPGADARTVAEEIDADLEFPVMARSIYDVYRSLFAWVHLQESIIPLIISIIVVVAAFNIVGTLLMIILEKTREIGILSSMGASAKSLRRMFLMLGLYIGIAGVAIGELVSLLLAWIQIEFSVIPLPEEAYYMSTAPVELAAPDFLIVAVVTLLLCAGSSWLPARFASRIEPVRAIHLR
jgi:lipoprotein-releasing system permease protein